MNPATPLRLIVVGGGIAGLAAAHRLVELARQDGRAVALTLFEARDRLGGTIRTERVDGFLLDAGADSFISEKPWALGLAERLGLSPRLRRTDDRFQRVYVVRRGRLEPLPDGWALLAPTRIWPVLTSSLFSWRGKARMALDLVRPRRRVGGDESLASFVTRRLGPEVLDRVAQPLVGGIYTADPRTLSLAATMPRFLALEQAHGSLIRGLRKGAALKDGAASGARWSLFVTLAGGMGELVEALAGRLPAGTAWLGCPVCAVERTPRAWRVRLADGTAVAADGVILAGEAPWMAKIVRDLDGELARLLEGLAYASSAAVALAYPRAAIRHPLDAFGFVVPRSEGRTVIACTFASVKYPGRAPGGFALFRAFLGGALHSAVLDRDDAAVVHLAQGEVAQLLGITGAPVLTRLWRYPDAMPQYAVGHLDWLARVESRLAALPGLSVAGAAYRGVGVADCIRSGEEAAERLLAPPTGLESPPRPLDRQA